MRFTLRRPGNPVASACIHGMPCRDVASRVHVSVAGVVAGSAPEAGLALARLRVHAPARRAALAGVRGFNLLDAARGLVVQPIRGPAYAGIDGQQVFQHARAQPQQPGPDDLLGRLQPLPGGDRLRCRGGQPGHLGGGLGRERRGEFPAELPLFCPACQGPPRREPLTAGGRRRSPRSPARSASNLRVQVGISEAAGALAYMRRTSTCTAGGPPVARGTWRWLSTPREALPQGSQILGCPATTPRARANGARSRVSTARSAAMPVTRSSCR